MSTQTAELSSLSLTKIAITVFLGSQYEECIVSMKTTLESSPLWIFLDRAISYELFKTF